MRHVWFRIVGVRVPFSHSPSSLGQSGTQRHTERALPPRESKSRVLGRKQAHWPLDHETPVDAEVYEAASRDLGRAGGRRAHLCYPHEGDGGPAPELCTSFGPGKWGARSSLWTWGREVAWKHREGCCAPLRSALSGTLPAAAPPPVPQAGCPQDHWRVGRPRGHRGL